jgi:bifunctional ADP-heptose synthase (sugar kinase/adenylyltransferase)
MLLRSLALLSRGHATGAGDTFAAALAVALLEGRPLPEAARFANAAGALATTVFGAQAGLPRRERVLELLAKMGSPSSGCQSSTATTSISSR